MFGSTLTLSTLFHTCFALAVCLMFLKHKMFSVKSEPVLFCLLWSRNQVFKACMSAWHQGLALLIQSAQQMCAECMHSYPDKTLLIFGAYKQCFFLLQTPSWSPQSESGNLYSIEYCRHGMLVGFNNQISLRIIGVLIRSNMFSLQNIIMLLAH